MQAVVAPGCQSWGQGVADVLVLAGRPLGLRTGVPSAGSSGRAPVAMGSRGRSLPEKLKHFV